MSTITAAEFCQVVDQAIRNPRIRTLDDASRLRLRALCQAADAVENLPKKRPVALREDDALFVRGLANDFVPAPVPDVQALAEPMADRNVCPTDEEP